MKIKSFIALIPALFLFAGLMAQAPQETVYLKDGSLVRGIVVEYIVGDHIRIRTEEGKYHSFPASEVKKVKTGKLKAKFEVPVKQFGYYNNTTIGVLLGNSGYGIRGTPSIQTINGIQIKKFNFGLGLGLEAINGSPYMPMFAEGKYNLRTGSFSPFVSLGAGYNLALSDRRDWYGDDRKHNGGIFGGMQVGIRNYSKANLGFTLSGGYRFQKLRSTYNMGFYNNQDIIYQPVVERQIMHRIELRFGILFN